jgi:uncharacterized protein
MNRPRTVLRTAVIPLVLGAVVGLALSGCAVTDPTRYYALTALRAPAATSPATTADAITIGVGPVSLPGYLDRAQLVTRDGADALEILPYHRWAEPLDIGIAEAIAEDLAGRVGSERVAVFPWRGVLARSIDYQVGVAVARFDGTPGKSVTLDARWRLLGKDGKELAFKRTTITEPVTSSEIPALVAAMNRAIGGLGQDISRAIQSQPAKSAATKN